MSIDYVRDGRIVTITINRRETRNSLGMEHFRDLAHAWAAFRDDPGVWVAVITGVGPDFCADADLKAFRSSPVNCHNLKGGTQQTPCTPSCIGTRSTSR